MTIAGLVAAAEAKSRGVRRIGPARRFVVRMGDATITDVGTTYKLCRRDALRQLLPTLDPGINLEFNAYFLDKALEAGLAIVECPITFHARVGLSKGGNVDNRRALFVGLRMLYGITCGWKALET